MYLVNFWFSFSTISSVLFLIVWQAEIVKDKTKIRYPERGQHSDNPAFPNGQLVNFNIDRKKPFRDVEETIQVRNYDAGENDDPFIEKKVLVRVYGTDAQLNKRYGAKVEELPEDMAIAWRTIWLNQI